MLLQSLIMNMTLETNDFYRVRYFIEMSILETGQKPLQNRISQKCFLNYNALMKRIKAGKESIHEQTWFVFSIRKVL